MVAQGYFRWTLLVTAVLGLSQIQEKQSAPGWRGARSVQNEWVGRLRGAAKHHLPCHATCSALCNPLLNLCPRLCLPADRSWEPMRGHLSMGNTQVSRLQVTKWAMFCMRTDIALREDQLRGFCDSVCLLQLSVETG